MASAAVNFVQTAFTTKLCNQVVQPSSATKSCNQIVQPSCTIQYAAVATAAVNFVQMAFTPDKRSKAVNFAEYGRLSSRDMV